MLQSNSFFSSVRHDAAVSPGAVTLDAAKVFVMVVVVGLIGSTARGRDVVVDTNQGTIIGSPLYFNGCRYTSAVVNDVMQFRISDLVLLSTDKVTFQGSRPASFLVGNNVYISAGAELNASANGAMPGPGGGAGGQCGYGGAGGAGGQGGAGGLGGAGGIGYSVWSGTTSANAGAGQYGQMGTDGTLGTSGLDGTTGWAGSGGYNNGSGGGATTETFRQDIPLPTASSHTPGSGPGGSPQSNTDSGPFGTGGGGGQNRPTYWPDDPRDGYDGRLGNYPSQWDPVPASYHGGDGGQGRLTNLTAALAGGGGGTGGGGGWGGHGGGGGGGGGGGAGGSGGFTSVGIMLNDPYDFQSQPGQHVGGNGGNGGNGTSGGNGGTGGAGGNGGWGGGGGGAVEIIAAGRVIVSGTADFTARGGAGSPSSLPEPGWGGVGGGGTMTPGTAGQSAPSFPGNPMYAGGNGGAGAWGSAGGVGSPGYYGGAGGSGAGGTIKLVSSVVTGGSNLHVALALAGSTADKGKLVVGSNTTSGYLVDAASANLTVAGSSANNPFAARWDYMVGPQPILLHVSTPNIPGLVDAADPNTQVAEAYGLSTLRKSDFGGLFSVVDRAPPGAIAVLVRQHLGPAVTRQTDMGFSQISYAYDFAGYDSITLINLSNQSLLAPMMSFGPSSPAAQLLSGGWVHDPLFAGNGAADVPIDLPGNGVYLTLVPSGNTTWFGLSAKLTSSGQRYSSSAAAFNNGDVMYLVAVPEPSSLALLLAGAVALVFCAWLRR